MPFADVLGGSAWKVTSDGGCRQPAARRGHNVVQSSSTVTVRHVATPYVIRIDVLGIGWMVFPQAEVAVLLPAARAARAAKYMSAMGVWRPPAGPGDPGPEPASSCRSCMTVSQEDKLPPG